ncbi:MAG: hypothetical protein A2987_04515 [Omnitrophica bacterium RIFCSPLOWO2_01_FULL_45_10]|nr:MAG: hypothetical protein A2987_04515 [Omnitrophica bacterium RIFCSPLOWO2_01_FULL_45_10]
MRKKKINIKVLLVAFITVAFTFLCVGATSAAVKNNISGRVKRPVVPAYAPGEIIIKFKSQNIAVDSINAQARQKVDFRIKGREIKEIAGLPDKIKSVSTDDTTLEPVFKDLHREMSVQGKTEETLDKETFQKLAKTRKMRVAEPKNYGRSRIYMLRHALTNDKNLEDLCQELASDSDIEWAAPNYILKMDYVPNDRLYPNQWSHRKTDAESGWNIQRGDPNIIIAIIDSGVYYGHEDLTANIWRDSQGNPGKDFVDIDTAEYGKLNLYLNPEEDYTEIDDDTSDHYGHGTHTAGIAGAAGNNSIGIAGICHGCKIMPVRAGFGIIYVFDPFGNGFEIGLLESDDIANAITYAADNGAQVISMSFTGVGAPIIKEAIDDAYSKGVTLVASAGNDNMSKERYPAAYENVLAVGATAIDDTKASYSNYGDWVDVFAPGGDSAKDSMILSTVPLAGPSGHPAGYRAMEGTSMACPYVAGLAALLLSNDGQLKNQDIYEIIKFTADYVGWPGTNNGPCRVNVNKALSFDGKIAINSPAMNSFIRGTADITGSAYMRTGFKRYELYYALKEYPQNSVLFVSSAAPAEEGILGSWNTALCQDGEYILTLKLITDDNRELKKYVNVIVDNVNEPPVFKLSASKIAVIGHPLEFKVEAHDYDDPMTPAGQLTYSAYGLPAGAGFDSQTQVFSWQPTEYDKGTHELTFDVSDNGHRVTKNVLLSTLYMEEIRLTAAGTAETNPAIYGDKIVWESRRNGNSDIYMYDMTIGNENQITSDTYDQTNPAIYGDKIVWEDTRNGYYSLIYMYDISTGQETRISTREGYPAIHPAIYQNKIVWQDKLPIGLNNNLYVYDLFTREEIQIAASANYESFPAIYGEKIVWSDWRNGYEDQDIYMYDLSTGNEIQITTYNSMQNDPVIYQDRVVWQDNRNLFYNYGIYMYDISMSKETAISDNFKKQMNPSIYGDKIVWQGNSNADWDICMYVISADQEIQITDNPKDQTNPSIYENKIVWQDNRNGESVGLYDIYLATLLFSPQILSTSAQTAAPGELITVSGRYFGFIQGDSRVEFASGITAPVMTWSDGEIVCAVPQNARAGLLRIVTPAGSSNGIMITMPQSNLPPELSRPLDDKTIDEGQTLTFTISAIDPDRDRLRLDLTPPNSPPGASLVTIKDEAGYIEKRFTWTPDYAQTKTTFYSVGFTVEDGRGGQDYKSITVTVNNVLVAGAVYGRTGGQSQPLEGASVKITRLSGAPQVIASAVTDKDGKFKISGDNIIKGGYYINVSKEGYTPNPYSKPTMLKNNMMFPFSATLVK